MKKHIPFLKILRTSPEIVKIRAEDANEVEIIKMLKKKGVVVLLDFFSDEEISVLREEYEAILAMEKTPEDWSETHTEIFDMLHIQETFSARQLDQGYIFPNNLELDCVNAVVLNKLISSDFLKNITLMFFARLQFLFPVRIQLIRTKKMPQEYDFIPYSPHADRQHFLKFYCNLDDVTEKNGPLFVDTRASGLMLKWIQLWRGLQLVCKRHWNNLVTVVDEDRKAFLPIESKNNDLVIFDSNVPHFAGRNLTNRPRRVIIVEAQSQRGYKNYNAL